MNLKKEGVHRTKNKRKLEAKQQIVYIKKEEMNWRNNISISFKCFIKCLKISRQKITKVRSHAMPPAFFNASSIKMRMMTLAKNVMLFFFGDK